MKKSLHPLLILMLVVFLCACATYIIPAGSYERQYDAALDREVVLPDSFSYVQRNPISPGKLLMSFTLGLQDGADVIFFLLIIGGMFGILGGTGAISGGIANLLKSLKGREWLMIVIFMLLFGTGSAICGNFEEFLVFVPVILACCITAGYDSLTAIGIIFIAATAGYAGSITNTFTVGTAQMIAGLELFSGMGLRIAVFVIMEALSIGYVLWYASFIKKNPKLSGSYTYDKEYNHVRKLDLEHIPPFTVRQTLVLVVFVLGIAFSVWGMVTKDFYVDELSAVFLATGILGGIIGGLKPGRLCEYFIEGAKEMLLPCFVIGLAHSSIYVLNETCVMDTILHFMADLLRSLPTSLMACGMFVFHEFFNVIVPSGSAQAVSTMPIMAPLADASDVSRQTAVLAYQMGDAFTNILSPTSCEILAALAFCKVPFGKWVRFLLPLFIIWWIAAFAILVYAGVSGY